MKLSPTRVLVINGGFPLQEAMRQLQAQASFRVTSVDRLEDLLTELAVPDPVVMLGLRPQGIDPIDALRALAAVAPDVPVVLVGPLHERALQTLRCVASNLAHDLSITVCAEGVESSSTLEFLAGARCDLVQGELLCAPRPPHELERFLRSATTGLREAAHA